MRQTNGIGWQHGEVPDPPDGLLEASKTAWQTWFFAWFAANWWPDDLPVLRQVIKLYDEVERGGTRAADKSQLHVWMRSYGITPDGQLALRWMRPKPDEAPINTEGADADDPYGHLRVVGA